MAMDTDDLLARDDVKAFFITHDAITVIDEMFRLTRAVANRYGAESKEYTDQIETLSGCLRHIFGRPGLGRRMFITKEGERSLFCNEDNALVFGMIFFRDRSKDGAEIVPGTWSLHS
jgi:hypothetical protein